MTKAAPGGKAGGAASHPFRWCVARGQDRMAYYQRSTLRPSCKDPRKARHPLKRALTPATNPAGLGSALAAIYGAIVAIWNATHHHTVVDPQVIAAALGAAAFFYARFKVTPVADPRDGNGQPLVAVPPGAALINVPALPTTGALPYVPAQKTLIPPAAAAVTEPPAAAGPDATP